MKGVRMRFSLILLGFFFITSPDVSIFDFLPDVIGWFLIVLGLLRFSDIEPRGEDAKALALRMMLFSSVKLALSLFTFKFGTSDVLLVTFCYSIVELMTTIPFVTNLFSGLDYSSMRLGVKLDTDKVSSVRWFLYIFFFVKNLLAFLPACVTFFDTEATGNLSANTWFIDFEAAMRVLMVLSFFLSVILGIATFVYLAIFFVRLIKNAPLQKAMLQSLEEKVLSQPNMLLKKRTSFVLTFFAFALLFFADFYLDATDVLPDFVGFFLILVASIYMKKKLERKVLLLTVFSSVGLIFSLLSFGYRFSVAKESSFQIEYIFPEKTFTYPLAVSSAVLIFITLLLLFKTADSFNREYTKTKLDDSVTLFIAGGGVSAFFGFFLYALPYLNTTFVFPSLIFFAVFTALSVNYINKLKKQIVKDNR